VCGCKSGETRLGTTTVTLEREGLTLVMKEVPADICINCVKIMSILRSPATFWRWLKRWPGVEPRSMSGAIFRDL
jgi:hypothetical protein